jgi:hypothetical protein
MAREMRKRKVPREQISLFLGHLPKDSDATTSIYAPYDPEYCSEAVAAIEAVMAEIRLHLKRTNIDQTVLDIETLAKTIPSGTKAGIGDAKREEVRRLILQGSPHKEIMRLGGHRKSSSPGDSRGRSALSQLPVGSSRTFLVPVCR